MAAAPASIASGDPAGSPDPNNRHNVRCTSARIRYDTGHQNQRDEGGEEHAEGQRDGTAPISELGPAVNRKFTELPPKPHVLH